MEGATGTTVPDVIVARVEKGKRLEWTVVEDLSSDHLPNLVEWKTEVRVNKIKKNQRSGAELEEGRLEEVQTADGGEDWSGAGGGEHGMEAEETYAGYEGGCLLHNPRKFRRLLSYL